MTREKRRGARGGGSVYYDADASRWAAVVTITDPGTGRARRRKMTAPDKPTAQQHLKKMLAERDETGTVSAKNYTVANAINDLLAHP